MIVQVFCPAGTVAELSGQWFLLLLWEPLSLFSAYSYKRANAYPSARDGHLSEKRFMVTGSFTAIGALLWLFVCYN